MSGKQKRADCPCTSKCSLHGECDSCKSAHEASSSQTSCEKLGIVWPEEEQLPDCGIRLLDFTPCAG